MSTIDLPLTEVLEDAMEAALQTLGGSVMAKVDAYDHATARAAVVPQVPIYVDGELVSPPKIYSVPVMWPGSLTHRMHWPLTKGSYVELTPLGVDHSQWLTTATPNVPPPSTRRWSMSDLVALPIAPSPTATPPDATSYDSVFAVLWGQYIVGSTAAPDFVALAAKVLTELNNIKTAYDLHIHGTPAGNSTAPTVPLPTPSSVAATKLKAE